MKHLIYLILALLLTACSTTKVTEPVVVEKIKVDTLYQVKNIHQVDTCWQHDSVTVTAEGVDRWHTVYKVKVVERVDTVIQHRVDSVPKVVTRTVTKEKKVFSLLDELILIALIAMCVVGGWAVLRKN